MSHFGEWTSAYVDGQLSRAQAERLAMHALQCKECAYEIDSIRAARAVLLSARDVEPSPDLASRLMLVAGAHDGPGVRGMHRDIPVDLRPERDRDRTFVALTGELPPTGRMRRSLMMVAVGICAGVLALTALGSPTTVVPDLSEIEALTILAGGQSRTSTIAQVNLGERDNPIMVREQQGRLGTEQLDAVSTTRIAGRTVYVLSEEPLHIVWQSGERVVDLISPGQDRAVIDVIESYPNEELPNGIERRIVRGWTKLSGAN